MRTVVEVDGVRVALTTHALHRYRRRVQAGVTREEIQRRAEADGRLEPERPSWAYPGEEADADAWLVLPNRVAFVLRLASPERRKREQVRYVAATCLRWRRVSATDARWRREQAAEDGWAA